MASNDLKTWVSDKLMMLLGYSQAAVVNYLIAMAKKTKSPTELVGELVDYGFSSSGDTRSFAEEIFARVPRKTAGVNLYQKHEAEAAMLVRKQKTYALLDADDDEDEVVVEKKSSVSESRKSDKGKKRFRKKSGQSDESDGEA
jgi:pre-mRNA-splicing factor ATP-dependent RNA helicase DHX16